MIILAPLFRCQGWFFLSGCGREYLQGGEQRVYTEQTAFGISIQNRNPFWGGSWVFLMKTGLSAVKTDIYLRRRAWSMRRWMWQSILGMNRWYRKLRGYGLLYSINGQGQMQNTLILIPAGNEENNCLHGAHTAQLNSTTRTALQALTSCCQQE